MKNNENEKPLNIIFPNDLNDLIEYGKWQLTLLSSLKSDRSYKKNLILIDKEWINKWEEKTGYNYIKKQIFSYLIKTQRNKQNINEEKNKLNNIWINIKDKYQITDSNNLPKINNKKFLITINKNTKINAKEKFFIISSDIYNIFEKYFGKNICIKVGGLFIKKKLLMPFNYNDKNINYIYIDMLFLNKNNIYEILFDFPELNLKIIEKIRKELAEKEISILIKELHDNKNELIFNDEDGTQYKYKTIYKDIFLIDIYKDNIAINKIKENNKVENNAIIKIKNSMNILNNLDVNNLNMEELEKKIKEIENENKEMMKLNDNLKERENSLLKEINEFENEKNIFYRQKNQPFKDLINDINFEEEEAKLNENLKEMEFKNQHLIDEIQEYQEKENILNNKYKESKSEYQKKENELNMKINELENKEKMIRSKDDNLMKNRTKKEIEIRKKEEDLKKLEKELNEKENELDEKEEEINLEEESNKEKAEEIKNKNEEILDKLKIVKKKEEIDDEIKNNELDEEIKMMEEQMSNNLKSKNSKDNNYINEEENEEEEEKEDGDNMEDNKKASLSVSSKINYRKMKSMNQDNPSRKSIKEKKNKSINEKINKYNFSSKELNTRKLSDFVNSNVKMEIPKDKPSLGIRKIKQPVNLIAIIQCFVHLIDITDGILELKANKFFNEDNKNKISKSYAILIDNLFFPEIYGNNSGVYSIDSFYDLIIKENKQLNNLYINSKDILNFLIGELHKELNTKKTNIPLNENNVYEDLNEKESLCKYLEIFTKNNNSVISKYLFGLLKSKIICQGCKKEKYNFKCYSFLYFDLCEIKQFINKEKKNKSINLIDCFDYYNKPEYLLGENGLYCKNCKCKNTTTILKSIYSSHVIMPIIIDRGDDSNLNKDKIEFPDELDLSKYIEYKNSSKLFYLCGVVSNFGYSNNFGKFEAFCKMEQNSTWYNYNNEKVSPSSVEEVHNKGMQYILFYHKI